MFLLSFILLSFPAFSPQTYYPWSPTIHFFFWQWFKPLLAFLIEEQKKSRRRAHTGHEMNSSSLSLPAMGIQSNIGRNDIMQCSRMSSIIPCHCNNRNTNQQKKRFCCSSVGIVLSNKNKIQTTNKEMNNDFTHLMSVVFFLKNNWWSCDVYH